MGIAPQCLFKYHCRAEDTVPLTPTSPPVACYTRTVANNSATIAQLCYDARFRQGPVRQDTGCAKMSLPMETSAVPMTASRRSGVTAVPGVGGRRNSVYFYLPDVPSEGNVVLFPGDMVPEGCGETADRLRHADAMAQQLATNPAFRYPVPAELGSATITDEGLPCLHLHPNSNQNLCIAFPV